MEYGKDTKVRTTTAHCVKLTRNDMMEMVNQHLGIVLPSNTRVTFLVPSGGNYSGLGIDISEDDPVLVEWEEVENA